MPFDARSPAHCGAVRRRGRVRSRGSQAAHLRSRGSRASGRPGRAAPWRRFRGTARSSSSSSLVVAVRQHAAVVEHDDLIGERDRRQAVGDDERRAPRHRLVERELDLALGRGVDGGGGVVEDQHARVGQQRAGDRQALALAAGQRQPALADLRLEALGQARDELVGLCAPRRVFDLLPASRRAARRRCSRRPTRRTGTGRR